MRAASNTAEPLEVSFRADSNVPEDAEPALTIATNPTMKKVAKENQGLNIPIPDKSADSDVTTSPLPELVVEVIRRQDCNSSSLCILEDNNVSADNRVSPLNSTHNMVANFDADACLSVIDFTSSSEENIAFIWNSLITTHGDFDEVPPSARLLEQPVIERRGVDAADLTRAQKDYYDVLHREIEVPPGDCGSPPLSGGCETATAEKVGGIRPANDRARDARRDRATMISPILPFGGRNARNGNKIRSSLLSGSGSKVQGAGSRQERPLSDGQSERALLVDDLRNETEARSKRECSADEETPSQRSGRSQQGEDADCGSISSRGERISRHVARDAPGVPATVDESARDNINAVLEKLNTALHETHTNTLRKCAAQDAAWARVLQERARAVLYDDCRQKLDMLTLLCGDLSAACSRTH